MKKYFSRDFNSMSIMLIPIAVAINVIGGVLALSLRLPIYLGRPLVFQSFAY